MLFFDPGAPLAPPGLQEATKNLTYAWQETFEDFQNAKDRFPDLVWDLGDVVKEMDLGEQVDQVWGHKGEFIDS